MRPTVRQGLTSIILNHTNHFKYNITGATFIRHQISPVPRQEIQVNCLFSSDMESNQAYESDYLTLTCGATYLL